MRAEKRFDSVQGFTYNKIADDYSIVFNDDGAGEIADPLQFVKVKCHSY